MKKIIVLGAALISLQSNAYMVRTNGGIETSLETSTYASKAFGGIGLVITVVAAYSEYRKTGVIEILEENVLLMKEELKSTARFDSLVNDIRRNVSADELELIYLEDDLGEDSLVADLIDQYRVAAQENQKLRVKIK